MSRRRWLVTSLVCIGVLAGCGSKTSSSGRGRASPEGGSGASPVVSPLSVTVPNPNRLVTVSSLGVVPPSVASSVNEPSLSAAVLQDLIRDRADELLQMKVVLRGSEDQADAKLTTQIVSYKERRGSVVGGEPATVAFVMTISRSSDGEKVWQANYFYRQEALSDNWLKLGQRFGDNGTGAGWLTARELFDRGVKAALIDFSERRDEQFITSRRRM